VPWLLVHGTGDESVSFVEAERLAAAGSRSKMRFLPIEGAGHTFGAAHPWAGSNPALDRAFDASVAFFAGELA